VDELAMAASALLAQPVVNGGGGVGEEVETDGAAASKSYALQI
jgi:hypothetical protein